MISIGNRIRVMSAHSCACSSQLLSEETNVFIWLVAIAMDNIRESANTV